MIKEELVLKYEGSDELDVNFVITSLQNTANSLTAIGNANGGNIQVNIKPFKEGSYEIIFSIFSDPNILSGAKLFYDAIPGDSIIKKFKSIFEFIMETKGKDIDKAKMINGKYVITGDNGQPEIIDGNKVENYYNNKGAVINIENLIIQTSKEGKIEGIKLTEKNTDEVIEFSREIIQATSNGITQSRMEKGKKLIESNVDQIPKTKEVLRENVGVAIVKPDLNGDTLWKVVFEGNEISVKINDDKFKSDVNSGFYSFSNGTVLLVDLMIVKNFDETVKVYKNKSYSIARFHKIIDKSEQRELFGD